MAQWDPQQDTRTVSLKFPQISLPHINKITGLQKDLLTVTSLSDISHLNLVGHNLKRGRSRSLREINSFIGHNSLLVAPLRFTESLDDSSCRHLSALLHNQSHP